MTVGQNFADGRGNFFASLNYTDESEIPVVARPFSNRNPDFLANPDNTGPDDGIPDQIFVDLYPLEIVLENDPDAIDRKS